MNGEKIPAKIPHFDGLPHDHWSELMENLLCAKGLWGLVENGFKEPSSGTVLTDIQLEHLENVRTKDHKVKHYLFRAIDRSMFKQVLDSAHPRLFGIPRKTKITGDSRVMKSTVNALRREFEVLEMNETKTITAYFSRVMAVANKMRSNGEDMSDTKVVEKILRTLTEIQLCSFFDQGVT